MSASPLPMPKRNRPGAMSSDVAVACASTAGWIRYVGQVTAVVISRLVVAAMAPMTDHTNGLSPWASIHGW